MKIVFASVQFATPYTPQRKFLSLGYVHASALLDDVIGPRTEMVHEYYDPSIRNADEIAQAIAEQRPDMVAFSCYVWNTPDILRIAKALKTMRPAVEVVLGGPEVSYHHLRILEQHPYVDWVAVNEGEDTFRELLRARFEGRERDIPGIQGLARRESGKAVSPIPRPYLKDLDRLPSPYLTGVLDVCDIRHGANYQTARGCPFVCTFCDYGRNQPYFEFSIERVRAEFEFFKTRNARILFNTDPTFNYSRKRAEAILGLAIELDIKAIHWFEVFPSLVNDELVDLLERSYCSFVGCGIQTSNPRSMKSIRRVWKPDKIAPILDRLSHRRNVLMSYEIIMGLPGDTLQDYKNTVSWTYERNPSDIKAFNLAILPRTPLEAEIAEGKWSVEYNSDIGHEILKTDDMDRRDVMIGKGINDWHRILQSMFFRLREIVRRPAADLIESWGWRVYEAGLHEHVHELQVHRISPELVEKLGEQWRIFVQDLCRAEGQPDVSLQFRDLLRYHFFRRARTWASTFFADVRDIYFNEPHAELHRFFDARERLLPAARPDAAGVVPRLGGEVGIARFAFDMHELFPRTTAAELASATPRATEYAFFMTPDTGAGCGIVLDAAAHAFIELVDGQRTVAEIGARLTKELGTAPDHAARLYAALEGFGLFAAPRFLTDFEEGKVSWQSAFPEHFRAYH